MDLLKWKKIIKNKEKNKIISKKKNKWNVNLNEIEYKIKKKNYEKFEKNKKKIRRIKIIILMKFFFCR